MHAAGEPSLPPPLPPLPRRMRLARGSLARLPIDVTPIVPPHAWSPIVPMCTSSGLPLLARDRRAEWDGPRALDRAAAIAVTVLAAAATALAVLLAT